MADRDVAPGLGKNWGIPDIDIPPVQSNGEVALKPRPDDSAKPVRENWGIPAVEIPPVQPGLDSATTFDGIPPAEAEYVTNGALGAAAAVTLNRKARLIPHATDSSVIEYYRRLRTKILQKREEKPFKHLLVTSANPQEGKTVTVMNLGLSFSMLPEFKVLIVDADFRRGSLGNWMGLPPTQPGLSDLIDGSATLEDVVLKSDAVPMHFIVRGRSRATDVHASQFEVHFRKLAESYDLIIVDSPPVNLLADVQVLANCCGAVLLVARSFVTSRQALEKAARELERFNVIGTVLNASSERRRSSYYDYYQGRA
jgi:capsular exopolysaccharide synthesis family protein